MDEPLTPDQLRAWEAQLRTRLDALTQQVQPLLDEAQRIRQQVALVQQLISVTEGRAEPPSSVPSSTPAVVPDADGSIADVVAQLLREAGEPLHIHQLRERFLSVGRTIPGQGTDSNLLSYIVRDARFRRVSKGTYALSTTETTPTSRPKRRRRRARSR